MSAYTSILRPFFFQFDPEAVHHFSMALMGKTPLARLMAGFRPAPSRPLEVFGLKFRNPLGLAAGFDKNAQALAAFHDLGFGFMEVGTITRHGQPGNPRPRIFRCPREQGLVNRMGFPNDGADVLAARLAAWKPRPGFPIGINLGKSKSTPLEEAPGDYRYSFERLHAYGDFFVVNVSSPNTPGLRNLQAPDQLRPILRTLQEANQAAPQRKPLLLKIAPDLAREDIAAILALVLEEKLDGIVATNTTLDHSSIALRETGGLSGRPLTAKSTEIIRFIHRETSGKLPIIGVGGIFTADDAREKLDAGAVLVQSYTGFIYQGPAFAWQVLKS
ncbi:MAG: quinone-dependent dihydroorotate dehydrogenase [Candidatus Methylacidiphilales bacterium]|nr:quinone-dependent dihydroorotate dehydrogenase [Candidatus Methylacidiphilales bacterium]